MIISEEFKKTLEKASIEAKRRRNEFVTTEHILLALTYDQETNEVLFACGVDIDLLREDLINYLDNELEQIPEDLGDVEPCFTVSLNRIMQLASFHVQSSNKKELSGSYVLTAIFREEDSFGVYFLEKQDITRLDVVKYISHGVTKPKKDSKKLKDSSEKNSDVDVISKFCVNLNKKAASGQIDPIIGREEEIDRLIQILCRRKKNNPILVGDPGVGKTAIVEGLADRIFQSKIPDSIKEFKIFSLDLGLLIAGTKYRGEFEERLKQLMENISQDRNNILFIDEIHTIIGAGSVSGGTLDASNLLKPALASGELQCIGTTTFKEYRSIFEKDQALSRRFQKIDVNEPSIEDSIKIIQGLVKKYEEYHGIRYSINSIRSAVELTNKYIVDRRLPDKAIDILDEVGSFMKLNLNKKRIITSSDIEEFISKTFKNQKIKSKGNEKEKIRHLEDNLLMSIFGQDNAIMQLVQSIELSKAGLSNENKPIGSFLFAGPTGVGKTELARQLSFQLGVDFIRFDMSEYMEKHNVSKLIGSPPGYIGYEEGGQLTDAIYRYPYSVLLLDEIEKAHEEIYNILLQIMDHATLTDGLGRKINFKEVILIMTTNSGAVERTKNSLGFGEKDSDDSSAKAVEREFSPEFRNRLTSIIQFNSLDQKTIFQIIKKELDVLNSKLKNKKINLMYNEELFKFIQEKAYDKNYGARPIQRWIESNITKLLSKEVLYGSLVKGGNVSITIKDEQIQFDIKNKVLSSV